MQEPLHVLLRYRKSLGLIDPVLLRFGGRGLSVSSATNRVDDYFYGCASGEGRVVAMMASLSKL